MEEPQALFDLFTTTDSWMTPADNGRVPVRVGIADGFIVICVARQFDAGGNVTRVDFWFLIRLFGYNGSFQHAHTIKVVSWPQDDTYLIDLLDDLNRSFHIELIFPDQEPNETADWKRWRD